MRSAIMSRLVRSLTNTKPSIMVYPIVWALCAFCLLATPQRITGQHPLGDFSGKVTTRSTTPDLQTLHCPWFYVGEDFVSFIAVKNTTANQLNVYLTVRFGATVLEDGSYHAAEPLRLEPGEARTINLRRLRQQQRKVFGAAVSGGLELMFFGQAADLLAKTSVISSRRRISFDVPFSNPQLATSTTLDSVWWFIGGDYRSYVELKNTADGEVIVTLTVRSRAGQRTQHSLALPARQSRAVDLRDLKPVLNGAASGSIEIEHSGLPGAVVAHLTTVSPGTGLSFDSPFVPRTVTR